mmetsp:Transcript_58144/g.123480  ORF Transcript_58144/g.123480 Transcript_58144/m.123480 type:complete len:88 (+) Transcript_58144:794-1057(+)
MGRAGAEPEGKNGLQAGRAPPLLFMFPFWLLLLLLQLGCPASTLGLPPPAEDVAAVVAVAAITIVLAQGPAPGVAKAGVIGDQAEVP